MARKKPVHAPRVCKRCGAQYTPTSSHSSFCSRQCFYKANHARHKDDPRFKAQARERASKWREENRERHRAASLAWSQEHRDRYRRNMRAAQRRRAVGRGPSEVAYGEVLRLDPCSYCGGSAGEIDHITAVTTEGLNHWTNFTAACKFCNSRKNARPLLIAMLEVSWAH